MYLSHPVSYAGGNPNTMRPTTSSRKINRCYKTEKTLLISVLWRWSRLLKARPVTVEAFGKMLPRDRNNNQDKDRTLACPATVTNKMREMEFTSSESMNVDGHTHNRRNNLCSDMLVIANTMQA